jgi:hypothetical protein
MTFDAEEIHMFSTSDLHLTLILVDAILVDAPVTATINGPMGPRHHSAGHVFLDPRRMNNLIPCPLGDQTIDTVKSPACCFCSEQHTIADMDEPQSGVVDPSGPARRATKTVTGENKV